MDIRPVLVRWEDATTDVSGWEENGKKPELYTVTTLGFLVYKDDDLIQIASTICDGENTARMGIPYTWVIEIVYLDSMMNILSDITDTDKEDNS